MNRVLLFTYFFIFSAGVSFAQNNSDSTAISVSDSLIQMDTIQVNDSIPAVMSADSVSKMPSANTGWAISPTDSFFRQHLSWELMKRHPYFGFSATPLTIRSDLKKFNGKESLFYLIIIILIIYALLQRSFPKYHKDLFRLLFRTTLKQSQIREQLMETPLPAFLWNCFFVISGGLYIAFLLQHFDINPFDNFWFAFLFAIFSVSGIYLIKFVGLKISGWLFNVKESANAYIFIVFVINKMIGMLLIPFLIILAFTTGDLYKAGLNVSYYFIASLLIYRIILTFGAVHNQVKVNPFHFFLYICAFEIAPLLLIYKGLLLFFRITT